MEQFLATIYGQPAPQGSKRFMGTTKTGKGLMRESSDKLTPWRNQVVVTCTEELDALERPAPFAGAVMLELHFSFNRPASVKRSKRPHMSIAPDLSKIIRATEDGLADAGVFVNDCLVVSIVSTKNYVNEGAHALDRQGCRVIVRPVVPWEMPPGRGRLELEAP